MITLPKFAYLAPTTVADACKMLADGGDKACAMAGGTDVILRLRRGTLAVDTIVGLKRIPELNRLTLDADRGLTIGATALLADVASHDGVVTLFPALAMAARETATPQIRNVATVVGNVCNASPCADNPPALIAYGAQAIITSPDGERRMPVEEVFTGPGHTRLAAGDVMTAVCVPPPARGTGVAYRTLSPAGRAGITSVSVASMLRVENGTCEEARIVLGAVAPTPLRVPSAERLLTGRVIGPAAIAEAAAAAAAAARPISDVRASADYRRRMVEVLARRALVDAERRSGS